MDKTDLESFKLINDHIPLSLCFVIDKTGSAEPCRTTLRPDDKLPKNLTEVVLSYDKFLLLSYLCE